MMMHQQAVLGDVATMANIFFVDVQKPSLDDQLLHVNRDDKR
jgi:hypothetical protein